MQKMDVKIVSSVKGKIYFIQKSFIGNMSFLK